MNYTNFTTTFANQITNPDCSYLSGMMLGNLLTVKLVLVYILIGVIISTSGGFISLFFTWLKKKLKLEKSR